VTAGLAPLPARFARLVKIEHTVFALPFAYVGAFLAVGGTPSGHDLLWITLAMVGARSLAMALNRLIDAGIDARNPRTAGRELPSGQLSVAQVAVFCAASLALFLVAVWELNPIVRWLWPIPVVGFVVYPYLKRFTWLCHFWLGAVDGLAPVGAWVAITGRLPWQSWMLGAAVAFWVAGFDFFYALFDEEIDRREGLHSIVTRFGPRGAFVGARLATTRWDVLRIEVNRASEVRPSTGQAARMFSMNLPNWRHDPYVEATYPPGKLQRLATELDGLTGFAETRRIVWQIRQIALRRHSTP